MKINTARIRRMLDSGQIIYSQAAGRVGEVIGASGHSVTIAGPKGRGVTTFEAGDSVQLVHESSNEWKIINVMDTPKSCAYLSAKSALEVKG